MCASYSNTSRWWAWTGGPARVDARDDWTGRPGPSPSLPGKGVTHPGRQLARPCAWARTFIGRRQPVRWLARARWPRRGCARARDEVIGGWRRRPVSSIRRSPLLVLLVGCCRPAARASSVLFRASDPVCASFSVEVDGEAAWLDRHSPGLLAAVSVSGHSASRHEGRASLIENL
jgi:hypothetical protein